MSVASRLISGSAASWAQVGVTMLSQIALVPIYLSHWSIMTYGIWLAIQSLVGLMSTFDFGHQEFLAYEFLRFGKDNPLKLSKYIWSGVCASLIISALEIFIIIALLAAGALPLLLGKTAGADLHLIHDAGIVILLQAFTGLICTNITSLLWRSLASFGYFPRMAWLSLIASIVSSLFPAVAVVFGANLLTTGIITACAIVLFSLGQYYDLFRIFRKENIPFSAPSLRLGYQNFLQSIAISGRVLLESFRQQGVRLIIAPLSSAAGLAAFSTMRTGANVALQGLNTVVNPLMPELMGFLHKRDQERSEAAFGTVWFVLIAIMAPATVILQVIVGPLYSIWTRGKVPFNPLLFAILSLSVLVYAAVQPAMAVVRGFNMLKAQLLLSLVTAIAVIGGVFVLMPMVGILGAGVSLLIAEVFTAVGYKIVAQRCLSHRGLKWPNHHFLVAVTSVCISAVAMSAIIWLPSVKWLILLVTLLLLFANIRKYWRILPSVATHRAKHIMLTLPVIKKVTYIFDSVLT